VRRWEDPLWWSAAGRKEEGRGVIAKLPIKKDQFCESESESDGVAKF